MLELKFFKKFYKKKLLCKATVWSTWYQISAVTAKVKCSTNPKLHSFFNWVSISAFFFSFSGGVTSSWQISGLISHHVSTAFYGQTEDHRTVRAFLPSPLLKANLSFWPNHKLYSQNKHHIVYFHSFDRNLVVMLCLVCICTAPRWAGDVAGLVFAVKRFCKLHASPQHLPDFRLRMKLQGWFQAMDQW